jgi:phage-related protein
LKGLPGYTTISGFMEKAAKVWDKIKGFFGRIAKAFKSFFETMANAIEEILNGFANEGLAYLPKLIHKIVGDTVWDVIEPIVNAAASSAEAILQLFETDPPKSASDFFPWALRLMKKAFGVAFDSIGALISALHTMMSRLGGLAVKIVNHMVHEGMVGVKRHQYHVWVFGNRYFLAADEYKINVLGVNIHFKEDGLLINPNDLVGAGLFTVLEQMGVPPTNTASDPETGDSYRDRWA